MNKIKFLALSTTTISVLPALMSCQSPKDFKEPILEDALKNVELIEEIKEQEKEQTLPSSLSSDDFKITNLYSGFKQKIYIQPNDKEGKANVFALIVDKNNNSAIKEFSFENYYKKSPLTTEKITQKELDKMLDSLSLGAKFILKQKYAHKITKDDFFIMKGLNVLDSSYEYDIDLLVNQETSELFVTIKLKKDGLISIAKEFPILGGFAKYGQDSQSNVSLTPSNWPKLEKIESLFTKNASNNPIQREIINALKLWNQNYNLYFDKILYKMDNKQLKSLSLDKQKSFDTYFIKIKNITKKFLTIEKFHDYYYGDKESDQLDKIIIFELKSLFDEVKNSFIEFAKIFVPFLTLEKIEDEINNLAFINKFLKIKSNASEIVSAKIIANKLNNKFLIYSGIENEIKTLNEKCANNECSEKEKAEDHFYHLALLFGQIVSANLKNNLNAFTNDLLTKQKVNDEVKIMESFDKLNPQFSKTIPELKLSDYFLNNLSKLDEFYQSLNLVSKMQNLQKLFNDVELNKETEYDLINLKLNIWNFIADPLPLTNNNANKTYWETANFKTKFLNLNTSLKAIVAENINTSQNFLKFYSALQNFDQQIKNVSNEFALVYVGVKNANVLLPKIIEQVVAKKATENNQVEKYDKLLTDLNFLKSTFTKIDSYFKALSIDELYKLIDTNDNLNNLTSAYLTQTANDLLTNIDLKYLDTSYLIINSK